MKLRIEEDVRKVDIPRLKGSINTTLAWIEFEGTLETALRTIQNHPEQGAECEFPPLLGYRKYKFHSKKKPARNAKPDMRLIYEVRDDLVVVQALGERKERQLDDICKIAEARLPVIQQAK